MSWPTDLMYPAYKLKKDKEVFSGVTGQTRSHRH
jgi:hypothetical protein